MWRSGAFSQARICPVFDGVQRTPVVAREIRPLGQVQTQEPIGVLNDSELPGAVWNGKEHLEGALLR